MNYSQKLFIYLFAIIHVFFVTFSFGQDQDKQNPVTIEKQDFEKTDAPVLEELHKMKMHLIDMSVLLQAQFDSIQETISNWGLQQKKNHDLFVTRMDSLVESIETLLQKSGEWKTEYNLTFETLQNRLQSIYENLEKKIEKPEWQIEQLDKKLLELKNKQKEILEWQKNFTADQKKQQEDALNIWFSSLVGFICIFFLILFIHYDRLIKKIDTIAIKATKEQISSQLNPKNIEKENEREWFMDLEEEAAEPKSPWYPLKKTEIKEERSSKQYVQPLSPQYVPPKGNFYQPKMITILDTVLDRLFAHVEYAEKEFPGHETGGAFIGKIKVNPLSCWEEISMEGLLSGGKNAQHQPAFFGENRESQTCELENYQAIDDRISFLGDWHRHPDGMDHPSHLDKRTDSKNVEESILKAEKGGFIYMIVCRPKKYTSSFSHDFFYRNGWKIHFYYMPSEELEYFPFVPNVVPGQILAAPPKLGKADIRRAKAEFDALKNVGNFLSYETTILSNAQEYLCVHIYNEKKAKTMTMTIPPNYPQIAPMVYRYDGNTAMEYTCDLLKNWKSEFCLINIYYSQK